MEDRVTIIALGAWRQFWQLSPYLIFGIILAAALKAFLPQANLKSWFTRAGSLPVIGATALGVGTPL